MDILSFCCCCCFPPPLDDKTDVPPPKINHPPAPPQPSSTVQHQHDEVTAVDTPPAPPQTVNMFVPTAPANMYLPASAAQSKHEQEVAWHRFWILPKMPLSTFQLLLQPRFLQQKRPPRAQPSLSSGLALITVVTLLVSVLLDQQSMMATMRIRMKEVLLVYACQQKRLITDPNNQLFVPIIQWIDRTNVTGNDQFSLKPFLFNHSCHL